MTLFATERLRKVKTTMRHRFAQACIFLTALCMTSCSNRQFEAAKRKGTLGALGEVEYYQIEPDLTKEIDKLVSEKLAPLWKEAAAARASQKDEDIVRYVASLTTFLEANFPPEDYNWSLQRDELEEEVRQAFAKKTILSFLALRKQSPVYEPSRKVRRQGIQTHVESRVHIVEVTGEKLMNDPVFLNGNRFVQTKYQCQKMMGLTVTYQLYPSKKKGELTTTPLPTEK